MPPDVPASGPITIALTGDTSAVTFKTSTSAGFTKTAALLRGATLGFTNLEVSFLDGATAQVADQRPAPRWFFAPATEAGGLRETGVNMVSLANNHGADFGPEGLTSTLRALDAAGIVHAGAGADLAAARAPAYAGGGARRVAVIAVTASASDQSRASASQPDIQGRPGVNALTYEAAITVDPDTFRTLAQSVAALQAGPPPGDRELTMFGRTITRGEKTHVEFSLNTREEHEVLDAIRAARQQAELVIVSVHSHEPSNDSDDPSDFLRRFAHDAVDAGARLVVGHGPHRLRAVEIYKGAAIFYSLGNFIYETEGLDFRAADAFDAGGNLYSAALGASPDRTVPSGQLTQEWWWQSALVMATWDRGGLQSVKLYPLVLTGADQPAGRGLPELAAGAPAGAILRRISTLSASLGTTLPEADSTGVLNLPISENR